MVEQAYEYLAERLDGFQPQVCLVLGSGSGKIAGRIEPDFIIEYADIPGFRVSTAPGHAGRLLFGRLGGKDVVCMQGRLHYYEGYSMQEITFPIRVLRRLGATVLLLTNAAGGINREWDPGDIMAVEDHINFMGSNPLIGPNCEQEGVRFPDLTQAYDPDLICIADQAAAEAGFALRHGVYLATTGPSFETPAEIRAFRSLGADAVGMSTVPEVIQAAHCGCRTLVLSLITNMAAGILDQPITSGEVTALGEKSAQRLGRLIEQIVERIGGERGE